MVRTLVLVAAVGFVLCIGSLIAAFSLAGGPFFIRDWQVIHDGDEGSFHWTPKRHHGDAADAGGPSWGGHATRVLAWTGGDTLEVDVPADIVYTQGSQTKLTIAGPSDAVAAVRLEGGRITFDRDHGYDDARLKIEMTAPGVTRFDLTGSQNLVLENYKQAKLSLDISGAAHVSAKGEAKEVGLDIAGSGDADLAELAVQDARLDISGSGHARIGPKGNVKVDISGQGDVDLTAKPAKLTTDITGSGHVSQPGMPD